MVEMVPLLVWTVLLACTPQGATPEPTDDKDPVAVLPAGTPETAQLEVWNAMATDVAAVRHPSDGGGAVVIVEGPEGPLLASGEGRWTFEYTAGPLGVAEGGALVFQAPPFWGWSPPQDVDLLAPGFVLARTSAAGVTLESDMPDRGMYRMTVRGRALKQGETITLVYGAGDLAATVDRYAEAAQTLWFAVDGDGDGVRQLVEHLPVTSVVAGEASQLVVQVPTTARPGEVVRLTIAAVDQAGNMGPPVDGEFEIVGSDRLGLPPRVAIGSGGRSALTFRAPASGVYEVVAVGPSGLVGKSGPMVVHPDVQPVLWADLQVHTGLSDGSSSLDEVYAYARDVAGLDAVAVTDHDHWGMRFLDQHPELWEHATERAQAHNVPGQFTTFVAFEWTNWLFGHRHVLYAGDQGPLVSSMSPDTSTPQGLWDALRPHDAMTIAHHVAGGPVAIDWSIEPDPLLEPVTEVCSVHGSSEATDSPGRIYNFRPGHSVRDALGRGYRLGMLCSTDGHDGHPGLAQLQAAQGGLAAILTEDNTRAGIFEAIRARRVYGTNGVRMLLRLQVNGAEMGTVLADVPEQLAVEVRVVAGADVVEVAVIRGDRVVSRRQPGRAATLERFELSDVRSGEFVYVRVATADGGLAWSSPVWVP